MLKKFLIISYFVASVVLPFFVLADTAASNSATTDTKAGITGIEFTPAINIPGSIFTEKIVVTGNTLAKYIVAVYRYGGIFAGVVAMFMLVYAGWEWLLAGGNTGKISRAKEKINGTLIGLALLFGGYVLLSLISANLVTFKSLDTTLPNRTEICSAITEQSLCTKSGCVWTPATNEQIQQDPSFKGTCKYTISSTACDNESLLVDIRNVPGVTVRSDCKDPRLTGPTLAKLTAAGNSAALQGYQLYITGAFRTAAYQQELYDCYINCTASCTSCNKASKPDCQTSTHMQGIAVDVCLVSGGTNTCEYIKAMYNCHTGASSEWCNSHPNQKAAQLALQSIMTQAGFTSISDEWWHYQAQ